MTSLFLQISNIRELSREQNYATLTRSKARAEQALLRHQPWQPLVSRQWQLVVLQRQVQQQICNRPFSISDEFLVSCQDGQLICQVRLVERA